MDLLDKFVGDKIQAPCDLVYVKDRLAMATDTYAMLFIEDQDLEDGYYSKGLKDNGEEYRYMNWSAIHKKYHDWCENYESAVIEERVCNPKYQTGKKQGTYAIFNVNNKNQAYDFKYIKLFEDNCKDVTIAGFGDNDMLVLSGSSKFDGKICELYIMPTSVSDDLK